MPPESPTIVLRGKIKKANHIFVENLIFVKIPVYTPSTLHPMIIRSLDLSSLRRTAKQKYRTKVVAMRIRTACHPRHDHQYRIAPFLMEIHSPQVMRCEARPPLRHCVPDPPPYGTISPPRPNLLPRHIHSHNKHLCCVVRQPDSHCYVWQLLDTFPAPSFCRFCSHKDRCYNKVPACIVRLGRLRPHGPGGLPSRATGRERFLSMNTSVRKQTIETTKNNIFSCNVLLSP